MNRIAQSLLAIIALVSTTTLAAELKYSITPNFFEQNPDNKPLGPCHGGVVVDKAGNIYVSTDTERGIVVFSPAGKFLRAIGPTRIHGLEVREEYGRFAFRRRQAFIKTRTDSSPVPSPSRPTARSSSPMATGRTTCSSSTRTASS